MAEASEAQAGVPSTANGSEANGDVPSQLKDLIAQATLKYSIKDYNAAAELYSHATELQAEENGEMSPDNADLLYAYGRCLYHLAVRNSDVLGSKVAGEKPPEKSKKSSSKKANIEKVEEQVENTQRRIDEEIVTKVVEEKDGPIGAEAGTDKANKPYFQFTGDENWDTSEDEDEDAEENGEGAEEIDEEDDFVVAYEVLDMARVLLLKKIEQVEDAAGKGKAKEEPPSQEVWQLKERLADTYDLQAEISLEGEKFPVAVDDLKSALELKKELFPQDSSLIAEAHYKLSLALEFSSVQQPRNEKGEVIAGKEAIVDEAMREDAVREMKAAIASCRIRIQKEEANLQDGDTADGVSKKSKVTKEEIEDVKEMVKDMEQRVHISPQFPPTPPFPFLIPPLQISPNTPPGPRTPSTPRLRRRPHRPRHPRRLQPPQRRPRFHPRRNASSAKSEIGGSVKGRDGSN